MAELCSNGGMQLEVDSFLAASELLPDFLDRIQISHVGVSWDDEFWDYWGEDEDGHACCDMRAEDAALQLQLCLGLTCLDCRPSFFPLSFPPALEELRWNPFIWGGFQIEHLLDYIPTVRTKSLLAALAEVPTLRRLELTLPECAARAPASIAKGLPASLEEVHVLVGLSDPSTSDLQDEEYSGSHVLDLAAFSTAAGFKGQLHVTVAYTGYSLDGENMLEHFVLPGVQAAAPFHSLKVLLTEEHPLHAKFRACAASYNEGLDSRAVRGCRQA